MTDRTGAERRQRVLAATAAGVAVVATLVIVRWGFVPLPTYPTLAEAPDGDVTGTIAYVNTAYERACVWTVVARAGAAREVWCATDREPVEALAWTEDGTLRIRWFGSAGPQAVDLDPVSGAGTVVASAEAAPGPEVPPSVFEVPRDAVASTTATSAVRPDGRYAHATSDRRGRVVVEVVSDTTRVRALDVVGPADHAIWELVWSPDGAWLLAVDSERRLLLLDADGGTPARLVATDARAPAWGP